MAVLGGNLGYGGGSRAPYGRHIGIVSCTASKNLTEIIQSAPYSAILHKVSLQSTSIDDQLKIESSVMGNPGPSVKIPGLYKTADPGIAFNKWNNPKSYTMLSGRNLPEIGCERLKRAVKKNAKLGV